MALHNIRGNANYGDTVLDHLALDYLFSDTVLNGIVPIVCTTAAIIVGVCFFLDARKRHLALRKGVK